ncbi:MAG TPA: metalloregulator ArsR/SmtB family transcription factor [Anaerohalosphaeraceae bacterium]|nr:metalloregulator ArsR/SmtB family transcription factor [Anaerohalosphaeraceae bacterium]HRT52315.1 metalloregulator ArsR/SmtB family transcription factor [Anaerohalosphaeraceae bacterium]HRT88316.1 metalloregulator ArsR/SmtB family transcription factor [Anaerohalosphaeraceae bacterium]
MRITDDIAEKVAHVLKAVGHPARLRIVELLEEGEMCVGDICEALGEKQAITSQHLNMMRDRDVLSSRRDGAKVYYAIKNKNVIKLLYCIYDHCDTKR